MRTCLLQGLDDFLHVGQLTGVRLKGKFYHHITNVTYCVLSILHKVLAPRKRNVASRPSTPSNRACSSDTCKSIYIWLQLLCTKLKVYQHSKFKCV